MLSVGMFYDHFQSFFWTYLVSRLSTRAVALHAAYRNHCSIPASLAAQANWDTCNCSVEEETLRSLEVVTTLILTFAVRIA